MSENERITVFVVVGAILLACLPTGCTMHSNRVKASAMREMVKEGATPLEARCAFDSDDYASEVLCMVNVATKRPAAVP